MQAHSLPGIHIKGLQGVFLTGAPLKVLNVRLHSKSHQKSSKCQNLLTEKTCDFREHQIKKTPCIFKSISRFRNWGFTPWECLAKQPNCNAEKNCFFPLKGGLNFCKTLPAVAHISRASLTMGIWKRTNYDPKPGSFIVMFLKALARAIINSMQVLILTNPPARTIVLWSSKTLLLWLLNIRKASLFQSLQTQAAISRSDMERKENRCSSTSLGKGIKNWGASELEVAAPMRLRGKYWS